MVVLFGRSAVPHGVEPAELPGGVEEYGTLRRTINAARYLSDPAYRRKISRQLNSQALGDSSPDTRRAAGTSG
ncbi:Tn3 family transposase [Saccharopolyspora sp. 5N102]|uniref:Tn3 family transposase n=1 Tax=Saccharopolyspora sp. 5N102 TaxID=3375155 RepID=UPI0037B96B83